MALAVAAIDASGAFVSEAGVRRGCLDAYAPGRFERRNIANQEWILDGAHNGEAAEVLAETIRNRNKGPFVVITGMVEGHDPERFYRPLLDFIDEALVVPIDSPRTFKQAVIAESLAQLGKSATPFDTVKEAICTAKSRDLSVLVTGSFYLIGEVVKHLS
jgi:dihydrofolate synthase/folylpolyglutamate synthase